MPNSGIPARRRASAAALVVVALACFATPSSATTAVTVPVVSPNTSYEPDGEPVPVAVPAGGTITYVVTDPLLSHTLTSVEPDLFDSIHVRDGRETSDVRLRDGPVTIDLSGLVVGRTYAFYCRNHDGMTGEVTIL